FVCRDADGNLANAFVCTANIDAADGGARIVEGNRKVLAARLSDARFFYDTDLNVPLEEQAKKLDRIVFHEKLGTVADKVERVAKLARWLVEEGIIKPSPLQGTGLEEGPVDSGARADTPLSPTLSPEGEREKVAGLAYRAAQLCKADLVTGMVGEFPELQGVMGGYYALAQGEDPRVAGAIRDHYKPVGQGDDVPTDPVTVAVSLADKLDTFVSFFRLSEFPTGSRDPFGLRRSVLAIVALLDKNLVRFSLQSAIDKIVEWHRPRAFVKAVDDEPLLRSLNLPFNVTNVRVSLESNESGERFSTLTLNDSKFGPFASTAFEDLMEKMGIWGAAGALDKRIFEFATDRLKVQQREAGVRHDLIDAVFALGGEDDLVRLLARVRALQSFITTEDGANLLAGYKRAANILKKEGVEKPSPLQGRGLGEGQSSSGTPVESPLSAALSAERARELGYTPEPAEAALIAALDVAAPAAAAAVAAEDFAAAMTALASLRAPIDAFFDAVTVNDADPAKREARLQLLARVREAVHSVADFSKIEG
ncbi:MAG: glycine--tRNA ligase subunit beta, partial [Sphingomonas sp.]|nr:glycine--tRNA ligase subunit beta [Sphingomonas sp.]